MSSLLKSKLKLPVGRHGSYVSGHLWGSPPKTSILVFPSKISQYSLLYAFERCYQETILTRTLRCTNFFILQLPWAWSCFHLDQRILHVTDRKNNVVVTKESPNTKKNVCFFKSLVSRSSLPCLGVVISCRGQCLEHVWVHDHGHGHGQFMSRPMFIFPCSCSCPSVCAYSSSKFMFMLHGYM
jgi:hypothetical protein